MLSSVRDSSGSRNFASHSLGSLWHASTTSRSCRKFLNGDYRLIEWVGTPPTWPIWIDCSWGICVDIKSFTFTYNAVTTFARAAAYISTSIQAGQRPTQAASTNVILDYALASGRTTETCLGQSNLRRATTRVGSTTRTPEHREA